MPPRLGASTVHSPRQVQQAGIFSELMPVIAKALGACNAGYITIYQNVSGLKPGGSYTLSFYQAAGQWRGYSGPTNDQWEVALGNICIVNCGPGFVGDIQYSQVMHDASHGVVPWEQVTLNFTYRRTSGPPAFLALCRARTFLFRRLFSSTASIWKRLPSPGRF